MREFKDYLCSRIRIVQTQLYNQPEMTGRVLDGNLIIKLDKRSNINTKESRMSAVALNQSKAVAVPTNYFHPMQRVSI